MNVENVLSLAAHVEATDRTFDMTSPDHCICGHWARYVGEPWSPPEMSAWLGLSYTDGLRLYYGGSHGEEDPVTGFFPDMRSLQYRLPMIGRAQAVSALRQLASGVPASDLDWGVGG
jgi:hypothetical protein